MTLTLRGLPSARRISSARRGILSFKRDNQGTLSLRYSPGLVDVLRVEP